MSDIKNAISLKQEQVLKVDKTVQKRLKNGWPPIKDVEPTNVGLASKNKITKQTTKKAR